MFPPPQKWTRYGIAAVVLAGSAMGIAAGYRAAVVYDSTPGVPAAPEAHWPTGASFPRPAGHAVLVMALHALCPCSQASVAELSELLAEPHDNLSCVVLIVPADEAAPEAGELWKEAAKIPGVTVLADRRHEASRIFHAHTSGQVLLYNTAGSLVFQGGITAGRGMQGPNTGLEAIEDFLATGRIANLKPTPVFGCALD